jgi:hypothetical protein
VEGAWGEIGLCNKELHNICSKVNIDPRFEGSNPTEDDEFLRGYKSVARLPSEGK